jgi:transcriptional regulator with XRE-family HTH domain
MSCIPVIDMIATGRNIARLRSAAGLTVKDLQDVFGFANPQSIYKWQNGSCLPTLDNMVILAAVLRVGVDDIIVVQEESLAS